MQNNGRIYWLTGQSGSGKTTIANRLKYWLAADKKNWRKSVHIIDEADLKNKFTEESYAIMAFYIARFLSEKGDDVIVSVQSPNREEREKFKSQTKLLEIYCHTKSRQININPDYEHPLQTFVDLDTSSDVDTTFKKLIRLIV
jgi:adenylylsulfate kinase-like enzyme